jgi:hypothetical protein
MKKTALLAMAAILMAALPAAAGVRLGFLGGYAVPLNSNHGSGIAYGAQFSLDLSPSLALELGALRYQSAVASSGDGLSQGTLGVLPLAIALTAHFPLGDKLQFFIGGGGDIILTQYTQDAVAAHDWNDVGFALSQKLDIAYGFHFRSGLELKVSPGVGLSFEARYLGATAKGTWTITDSLGGPSLSGAITGLNLNTVVFGLGLNITL